MESEQLPWDIPRFRDWVAVARVNQLARKAMGDGLATEKLDLPTYDVLSAVFRFPDLTQSELAEKLLVGRSNLSMLLPDIESKGWLIREADSHDKRVKRLRLTDEGMSKARAGLRVHVRVIEYITTPLSEQDCNMVGECMRKMGQFLESAPFEG